MKRKLQTLVLMIALGITTKAQLINTFAGGGFSGVGDGGLATSAQLNNPHGIAIDGQGNVYVVDGNAGRIRKINNSTGIITTVAGNGTAGYSGDNSLATIAQISPWDIAFDAVGNLYIADAQNNRVRKVDVTTGIIKTIAGKAGGFMSPSYGYNGDGILADSAKLFSPMGIVLDAIGNIYIGDHYNNRVRKIDVNTNMISTIAGNGQNSYNGDNIQANTAAVVGPMGLAIDATGNIYIAESQGNRVRKIAAGTGIITTVAGNGSYGYSGDGGLATQAQLRPNAIALDAAGNLYISDAPNSRIRKVDAVTNSITTVVGTGQNGYNNDGIPATTAQLSNISGVHVDALGNIFISDSGNGRLRKVGVAGSQVGIKNLESQDHGTITSVYPNPFTTSCLITFGSFQNNSTVTITDVLGKQLHTSNFSGMEYRLEKGILNSGVYFVRVYSDDKLASVKKIIIQ